MLFATVSFNFCVFVEAYSQLLHIHYAKVPTSGYQSSEVPDYLPSIMTGWFVSTSCTMITSPNWSQSPAMGYKIVKYKLPWSIKLNKRELGFR